MKRGSAAWPRVKLGDIGDSIIGLTYSPDNVKRAGTLVLRSSNIQDGQLAFDDNVYVDSAIPDRIRVRENDILICVRNGSRRLIGKSVLLDCRVVGQTFGAFMAVYRSESNPFLQYFFQSDDFKHQIDEHLGATINQITNASLNSFVVALPSAPEQHEIVSRLSDVDRLVATLERLIAKKRAMKQGMMQQLIAGAVNTSRYPKDTWREHSLGQLLLRPPRYGINAAAVALRPGVATYIRITDINDVGRFVPDPKVGVSHPNAPNYRLASGELVFARTGASVGKSYLYDPRDGELVYAGFLINVAPDPKRLNPRFLALYAQTKVYWDWVARTSVRSGQPGINGREYAQLPIALPKIETQDAIADAVCDFDGEIDALSRRLEKAYMVKVGMMQQLLTGRTRLPVVEVAS